MGETVYPHVTQKLLLLFYIFLLGMQLKYQNIKILMPIMPINYLYLMLGWNSNPWLASLKELIDNACLLTEN